jgi:hypothetical protein
MTSFLLIEQYLGTQLDIPLGTIAPGETRVVETTRRTRCEQSYGYIHALYGIWLEDGRGAVSVPPGAGQAIRELLAGAGSPHPSLETGLVDEMARIVNGSLDHYGLPPVYKSWEQRLSGCNAPKVHAWEIGDCIRLVDESIPAVEGLSLPTHCFPDGIVYGVVVEGQVVSCAYAHRSGIMEDRVADLGVETAEGYRKRGYAKTAVSAVTGQMTRMGGEALYNCHPANTSSIATTRSVGYELVGKGVILAAHGKEEA